MKFCAKCGNSNTDEAVFCASCGSPMEQAPAAPQPAEPVAAPVQPVYTAPAYSAPAAPAPVEGDKNPAKIWLILNIVATVLCCPGWLFTVIGIVMAAIGNGSFNKGEYADAKSKSKISMIMFIIGAVLGLIGWILMAIFIPVIIAAANY